MCGFQMKFENGYTVSVQWSPAHYCTNRLKEINNFIGNPLPCQDAEVAVFDNLGRIVPIGDDSDVEGYCTPESIVDILLMASCMESIKEEPEKKKPNLYVVK